jgi:anthranilate synthase component II
MKLLIVDNHDSFTYNLVHLVEEAGGKDFEIQFNDQIDLEAAAQFDKFLFSPGPGLPDEFPAMKLLLDLYKTKKSFLGICLGHQAIAEYFGGQLYNLPEVVHGQQKKIEQLDNDPLFRGLEKNLQVGLYHSWLVSHDNFPSKLEISALSHENRIMGLHHKNLDIRGLQFHPESIMTPDGLKMMRNWLEG